MDFRLFSRISLTLSIAGFVLSATTVTGNPPNDRTCRYIPGDAGWPSQGDWAQLNATVGGRLVPTIPLAHVCHQTGPFAAYDRTTCEDLGTAFQDASPATICPVAGEIFNPYWQNGTCSPFTAPEIPCELGNRAVYSINVTGPADVRAGLEFASEKNIRVVVRNTGIDYLGQSTGKGALAFWTYNLKSTQIIPGYESASYSGPAVKFGAGITAGEAYEAVKHSGYRIVAPECGLTGLVGGYVQAGGQSQLITAYGLAADQVLEWELVTPSGEYLVATPENNTDLYWALGGGGGGTYGVVLSATFRVYPEGPVAGGEMVVQGKNRTALFEAVEIWFSLAPSFVDNSRNNIQFFVTNDTLTILNFVLPDKNASSVHDLLAPFLPELDRLDLSYNLTATEYPTYLSSYIASYGPLPYGNLCPSFPLIASRLIPRETVQNPTSNKDLIALYRNVTDDGTWWIGCSFLNVDDSVGSVRPRHPPNAVHPAWRSAIAYCNPQTHHPYDWTEPEAVSALRSTLVDEIFPAIEGATPGGALLNELDPTYKGDWKAGFFGSNYDRLLDIKHAYDPHHLMYGRFAVGSDEFTLDSSGRLCEA
ncbi:FAD binding domain-containing protein [Xylaria intraflava]|nr:FAD binding domain-containing protein [Xylaria intraflava]